MLSQSLGIDKVESTKWVDIIGKRIVSNSVIVKFVEEGTEFYIVNDIILYEDTFYILCQRLKDVFLDPLYRPYKKNYDFEFDVLSKEDVENCIVSNMCLLTDDHYYISKEWM